MSELGSPKILVIGDLILDRYIEGTVQRMSPEAAVPVFLESGVSRKQAGGAAAVACMAAALGAQVKLAGVVGYKHGGYPAYELTNLCTRQGVDAELVFGDERREPTVKTRYVTPTGQVLRVDRETRHPWNPAPGSLQNDWLTKVTEAAKAADLVLIADYGKGVCTRETCQAAIGANTRTIVDPARGEDWSNYWGCWGIKPNEIELADIAPIGVEWQLTTLGARGMRLQRLAPHSAVEIPARQRRVSDVCGAGDQALSTLGVCLGSGFELVEACRWANAAAGLQCERHGTVPIGRAELNRELGRGKFVTPAEAAQLASSARQRNQRIVFTNGCFDLFTAGHAASLREAKAQGDVLFVGLNSDASARTLKGPLRPYVPQRQRAAVLEALECVDYVTIFAETTEISLLKLIQPDVLAKGGDYRGRENEIPGRAYMAAIGGRLHLTEHIADVSTTGLAQQIAAIARCVKPAA